MPLLTIVPVSVDGPEPRCSPGAVGGIEVVVTARRNTVAAEMAAGSSLIAKSTVVGGLAGSLFGELRGARAHLVAGPVENTMLQVIVVPPKGAVCCTTIGADSVPVALKVLVSEGNAARPSMVTSSRHERAVAGQVPPAQWDRATRSRWPDS